MNEQTNILENICVDLEQVTHIIKVFLSVIHSGEAKVDSDVWPLISLVEVAFEKLQKQGQFIDDVIGALYKYQQEEIKELCAE